MKVDEKKDSQVGFARASDGWHEFEITEQAGYLEDKEKGEATDTFMVTSQVVGDDEDEGAMVTLFCDLSKKGGRTRLAKVLGFSGVADIIEKGEKGINQDLSPVEWGEKYLNISNPKSMKLVSNIKVKAVGARFRGEVKTTAGKDSDGNPREYSNIINIAYPTTKKAEPASKPESTGPEEDEW